MSGTDDRVVSMQFDNAEFNRNVDSTLKSLDLLKKSLNFDNAANGFANIDAASKGVNLGHINTTVEGISAKFLALGTVAVTALANITSSAMAAGSRIVKSLTLDPVMDGFHEYETNMTAIQTILSNTAAKGTKLTDVNAALDQLNAYSDLTIYNFGEMARNIGTFTAAGVDLKTSQQSIKGIANLAAMSGSNSEQASTAMYQLSQAIAGGSVKLMDWNSVVNAGMGGEVFQKALFTTGQAMGRITNAPVGQTFEGWKKAGNSFRNSLSADGAEGESVASKLAKANKESSDQISDASTRASEAIQNATDRVADARKDQAKTAKDTAANIADAEKAKTDAAAQAAQKIADAEKNQADVFESTSASITKAKDEQTKTIADGAASVQASLDAVVEAQKRLKDAMKPESADKLQAATDRLTTSQLDQADLANAVTLAEREQTRSAEDLAAAKASLAATEGDSKKSAQDLLSARRRVEDAETRAADLTDAVERARLRQNAANRSVTEAEDAFTEAKKKGTAEDQNVIDAQKSVEDAQKAVITTEQAAQKANEDAAKNLADVEKQSADKREAAIAAVTKAHEDAVISQTNADQRLVDVKERSSEQQIAAEKRVSDAEKELAKTRIETQKDIAKAHEAAAERIKAAGKDTSKPPESWLSSGVLTQTLQALTGDLDVAQLKAMGYTDEQAKALHDLGVTGLNAAKDVKTFSQLMQTVKESVGTGWADTFRIVVGDFGESKALFTDTYNSINAVVSNSAKARNKVLADWKKGENGVSGRDLLIDGIRESVESLGNVIKAVKTAFRDIFPAKTGKDLFEMTMHFEHLAHALEVLTAKYAPDITRVFKGVFAIFDIVWTVVKGVVGVFVDLIGHLGGVSGGFLNLIAGAADWLTALDTMLVKGGGIHDFFEKIKTSIDTLITKFDEVKTKVFDFFGSFSASKAAEDSVGGVEDSLGRVTTRAGQALDVLQKFYDGAKDVLGKVVDFLKTVFAGVGTALADAFKSGDFNKVLDVINVGLLGGIVLLLRKFMKDGIKLDFTGGLFDKVKKVLDDVRGALKAFQTELKAKALMEIAIAMGVLTASILVLSLINSENLTKALIAITIGFGELVGVMKILDTMGGEGAKGASKLGILVAALIGIAGAAVVLSGAVALLGQLDWKQVGTGLAGLTGALAVLVGAIKMMGDTGKMKVAGGLAIIAMAKALDMLAGAVKHFGEIPLGELAQGMIAVNLALGMITESMKILGGSELSGAGMLGVGIGMIGVATAMIILSKAVQIFGQMNIVELAKGLIAINYLLGSLAMTVQFFPPTLPLIAIGLVGMAFALGTLAGVVVLLGRTDFGTLAKGLLGFSLILGILAGAMEAMQTALPGALAMVIVAGAMKVLSDVVIVLGKTDIKTLAIGIAAMAAVILILAVAAIALEPVIPMMFALGIALTAIGVAFLLFGAGALLAAKAFEIVSHAGKAGIANIIDAIMAFLMAIPKFSLALVEALASSITSFLKVGEEIIILAVSFLGKLLTAILKLIPGIVKALSAIIGGFLEILIQRGPEIIDAGFTLLTALLKGLYDHIDDITTLVIKILAKMVEGLAKNVDKLVNAGVDLLTAFIKAFTDRADDIVGAGLGLLLGLLKGIADNIIKVVDTVGTIIAKFIEALGNNYQKILDAGVTMLIKLVFGIGRDIITVVNVVGFIITKFLEALENNAQRIVDKGADLFVRFLGALGGDVTKIANAVGDLIGKIIVAVGNNMGRIADKGVEAAGRFLDALAIDARVMGEKVRNFLLKIGQAILDNVGIVVDKGATMMIDFLNKLADTIRTRTPELEKAFFNLAGAVVDGLTKGLVDKAKSLPGPIGTVVGGIVDAFSKQTKSKSPSRLFMPLGGNLVDGIAVGMVKNKSAQNSAVVQAERIVSAFQNSLSTIPNSLDGMDEMNPVITPVLDLTRVQRDAGGLNDIFNQRNIAVAANQSNNQAALIAHQLAQLEQRVREDEFQSKITEIRFEQNINAPKALSVNDIYRGTKSQIAQAKEELNI